MCVKINLSSCEGKIAMITKSQEKILKHILSLNRSPQNSVSIGSQMETYPIGIDEKELIKTLNIFEQHNLIRLKWNGTDHDSLNYAVDITILPGGDSYFYNKKIAKKNKTWDRLKWLLPLIVSILSLVWSICNTIYTWHLNELIGLK